MNRIFRLVRNRATGLTQVASELATTHASPAEVRAAARRRTPLSAALVVALGLAGAAPAAFAQVYEYNNDTDLTNINIYGNGFAIAPNGNTVTVNVLGSGSMTGQENSWVGRGPGSVGSLTINGPAAQLVMNGGSSLTVGEAGTGTLSIVGGGRATIDSTLVLGMSGGTGSAVIDGANSRLDAGVIEVGGSGLSQLDITNGAAVRTLTVFSGNNHGLSIDGLTRNGNTTQVSTVNVETGGTLNVVGNRLLVGESAAGRLNITSGTVTADSMMVGANVGAEGTLAVNAAGTLTTGQMILGNDAEATGTATISGAGAVANASSVWVSAFGNGTLTVQNGGVLAVTGDVIAERYDSGGVGTLAQQAVIAVTGNNSRIKAAYLEGTAVQLTAGGSLVTSSARLKDSHASTPTLTYIRGSGSTWTNDGAMRIESALDILEGGQLSTDTLSITGGVTPMITGPRVWEQVLVSGDGSTLTAANGITVGKSVTEPYGVLVAADKGKVDAGTGYMLAANGYLVVGGGADAPIAGTDTWTWRSADLAGDLGGAPITLQAGAGGVVLNHIGSTTLTNALISSDGTAGALTSLAGTTTLDGDLAAFGGSVKVSGGTLVINSSLYDGQSYTAPGQAPLQQLDISGGTLVLNGSAGFQQNVTVGGSQANVRSSSVRVQGQGVLAGNAVVGETRVTNGGTLSPGHEGIGTITIDGDLYLNAGGQTAADVASAAFYDVDLLGNGQADLISVTGKAYIGSTANIASSGDAGMRVTGLDAATSYQNGKTYVVLSAGDGVQGDFDSVVSRSAFITPVLSRNGDQVLLTIGLNGAPPVDPGIPVDPGTPVDPGIPVDPGTPIDPGTPVDPGTPGVPGTPTAPPPQVFNPVATTPNQLAVANGLNSLQQSGDALALYNELLMLDEASARAAFDELSGEIHGSNRAMLLDDRFLREGISQRLRPDPTMASAGTSVWVAGGGGAKRQDSDGSAARVRQSSAGAMAGIDWSFGGDWSFGVAVGAEKLRNKVDDRNADSDVDALHAGLYTGFRGEALWWNGGATFADYQLDTARRVGTGLGWAQTLNSEQDAHAVGVFTEGGWDIELDTFTLTPYLAFTWTRLTADALQEAGGNAALAVERSEDDVWTGTAGLRAAWDLSADQEGGTRLEAGLAWQHAGGDLDPRTRNRFVAGSDTFTVSGLPLAGDVAIAELGFSFKPTDNSRLSFFAQGRSGDDRSEFSAQLNWNVLF